MKAPAPEQREGSVCEAVGKLIGEGVEGSPALDLRQWNAIQSSLPARRRARSMARISWWLAGPVLAAGVAAAWLVLRAGNPPLTYVAEGFESFTGGVVKTTAGETGRILFSDGSTIALGGGTHGRIALPDRPAGAHLILDSGAADLDVVHGRDTRWAVEAGPFRVDVTGTNFHVSWSPDQRHFRLEMRRGEVVVSGGGVSKPTALRSGETLDVTGDQVDVHQSAARDGAAPPRAMIAERRANGDDGDPRSQRRALPQTVATESPVATSRLLPSAITEDNRPPSANDDPRQEGHDTLASAPERNDETMNKNDLNKTSRAARAVRVASAVGLGLVATASVAAPLGRLGSPVFIGSDGKLGGPMTGYAWVAGGAETTITTPSPCDGRGCFKDAKGQLCTRGNIPALRCSGQGTDQFSCNWAANWGSMIGMHTTSARGPWQAGAPASVSIAYQSHGDRGTYRLTAHVAGDPDSKVYCADQYQSGQAVDAGMLRTACWTAAGEVLDSFRQVDKIGLELTSTESPVTFDYCVTAVAVNGTAGRAGGVADGSHIVIGDYGRLGGEMTGYAWVAGGAGTAFSVPPSCNQNGCFQNAPGRLCAQGIVPALQCTGQGTPQLSCDWHTNWGAMIGLNANLAAGAWGATAPSTVALAFSSSRPGIFRLTAHIAGAPDNESFCIDGYQSGQVADARSFKAECWSDSGKTLSSYEYVDRIGLQIMSAEGAVPFDVCISDVVVR